MSKNDWLAAIYDAVDGNLDDKQALTAAAIAIDDEQAMRYQAEAFGRQLRSDLRSLERKLMRDVNPPQSQTSPIPQVDWSDYVSGPVKRMRQIIVVDGTSYDTASLAGREGAQVLETWAQQVRKGARTVLDHARLAEDTARVIVEASEKVGRDVSAAEVWGWKAAA